MFSFNILKLKLLPLYNFCSFTQSVVAGAQRARTQRQIRTVRGWCSIFPWAARPGTFPSPRQSLVPVFQLWETQLKADKERKIINAVISYLFPFIHLTSFSLQPGWRYKSAAEHRLSFHPYGPRFESSLSLTFRYGFLIHIYIKKKE